MVIGASDSTFHCYLLFGQSNMAGGGAKTGLLPEDCDTTSRVKVLAFSDCKGSGWSEVCRSMALPRKPDEWYTAYPPLHICTEGVSPGDYFAKTLLDSIREDHSIGLIPCALSGQALNVFVKGRKNFNIPTWAHPTLGNSSPYEWMLNRCKIAQQTGVIKGILLHQGESGAGDAGADWVTMAKGIFDSLKKDLALDAEIPVIVGELRQDMTVQPTPSGGNASFNANLQNLAKSYPHCGVASSKGLLGNGQDVWHFTAEGMRELGKRYAEAFLKLSDSVYIPRKGSTGVVDRRTVSYRNKNTFTDAYVIHTLDGRVVRTHAGRITCKGLRGGVFLCTQKNSTARPVLIPNVR